jgi:hypothetical protein
MSEFDRLKRAVTSWISGVRIRKKRRIATYQDDDALMILTDLGLQMSPEALIYISNDGTRREDFLMQLYAAEEDLRVDIIKDNVMIDPALQPKVYEVEGKIGFTIMHKKEEYLVAEYAFVKPAPPAAPAPSKPEGPTA